MTDFLEWAAIMILLCAGVIGVGVIISLIFGKWDGIRNAKGDEEWECLYNPHHVPGINGRCEWCGELVKDT